MMTVEKAAVDSNRVEHEQTKNLIDHLVSGDALVLNKTKVIPARLIGSLKTGAKVEVLLLSRLPGDMEKWSVMSKSSNKCHPGTVVTFGEGFEGLFEERLENGQRVVSFESTGEQFRSKLDEFGRVPLPPYIKREPTAKDVDDYQSVFAEREGSVAAPTASLHLSEEMLQAIAQKGVHLVKVVLHVGAGTFAPVKTEEIEDHPMHKEWYELSESASSTLNEVKKQGKKIFCVGTTSARVLETVHQKEAGFTASKGETGIFIYPGYQWKAVDGLLTNYHWPKSTLFMLVCSLLGVTKTQNIYKQAIENSYRLFSYGDSLLIY